MDWLGWELRISPLVGQGAHVFSLPLLGNMDRRLPPRVRGAVHGVVRGVLMWFPLALS